MHKESPMVGIYELEFVNIFILSTNDSKNFNKLLFPFFLIMGKPRGKADGGFLLQSRPADKGS